MIKRLVTTAALFLLFSMAGTQNNFVPSAAAHDDHAGLQPASAALSAPKRSPWGASYFPNVPLVTQDGKTVLFFDDLMKDKKVLINFIYALCDQACPLDTAKMAEVQKLLGPRVGRDFFIYSITLDPENDTPKALKAYAEQFGAGPGWMFLTGKREDIDKVRSKFGERGAKEQHANIVRAGDVATGRWMRLPLTAGADYLVTEIGKTLDPNWNVGKPRQSIGEAPRTEVFGPGQILFRNRCAGCHSFGKGVRLGPDLKGVTDRRERDWLIRYLAAPDKMRSAKDPIALDLAKRHKVLMPNLSLTKKELTDLVAYLQAQSVPPLRPEGQKAPLSAAPGAETPPARSEELRVPAGAPME